jgi:hypothetical protein
MTGIKIKIFGIFTCITIALVFCLILVNISDQTNALNDPGMKKANESVGQFLEKSNINIKSVKLVDSFNGKMYWLNSDEGYFLVNATTNKVEYANLFVAMQNSSTITLNPSQAESKAKGYAEKYNSQLTKNMQLIENELIDHKSSGKEYLFKWREIINGVYTLNTTVISVNPNTGELIKYESMVRPVSISLTPIIMKEDAILIAASQFNNLNMSNLCENNSKLEIIIDSDKSERLVWNIELIELNGYYRGGYVYVDALTGKVVSIYPVL